MTRIAKKSRSVKGVNKSKPSRTEPRKPGKKPARTLGNTRRGAPRYTIRKDSLDRRYAIDKRTGKRVSVSKAAQERARRKKAAAKVVKVQRHEVPKKVFRGIKQQKPVRTRGPSITSQRHKKRSEASKRGWETRRTRVISPPPPSPPIVFEGRPPSFGDLIGPLIPEGMKMHVVGGVAERAEVYPKVQKAADNAWINLQVEAFARQRAIGARQEPEPIITPRFDRLYGKGHGAHIRFDYYARATDLADIDQMVEVLVEAQDNDYEARELYTLYFSPEVA